MATLEELTTDLKTQRDEYRTAADQLSTALAALESAQTSESKEKSEYVASLEAAQIEIGRLLAEVRGAATA